MTAGAGRTGKDTLRDGKAGRHLKTTGPVIDLIYIY